MPAPVVPGDLRAFDIDTTGATADGGRRLVVTIRREFDFGSLHQDWAVAVINRATGPFAEVVVDMSGCGLVSSTFFAGLLQLRAHYTGSGSKTLHLRHPDPRVQRNLAIMRLDTLFSIEPRPKPA